MGLGPGQYKCGHRRGDGREREQPRSETGVVGNRAKADREHQPEHFDRADDCLGAARATGD